MSFAAAAVVWAGCGAAVAVAVAVAAALAAEEEDAAADVAAWGCGCGSGCGAVVVATCAGGTGIALGDGAQQVAALQALRAGQEGATSGSAIHRASLQTKTASPRDRRGPVGTNPNGSIGAAGRVRRR